MEQFDRDAALALQKTERNLTLTNEQIDAIWELLTVERDVQIAKWNSAGVEALNAILARLPM